MGVKRERILFLCEADPVWCHRLGEVLQEKNILAREITEPEELWRRKLECDGILISEEELDSLNQWEKFETDLSEPFPKELAGQIYGLRERQEVPVIILLREQDYETEYRYLQMGAAECIHKKQPLLLLAERIHRILPEYCVDGHTFGETWLDVSRHCLCSAVGGETALTEKEFLLLELLFRKHGTVMMRTEIQQQIWRDQNNQTSRRLDTLVKQLRRKLTRHPLQIATRYRQGYYLDILKKF